MSLGQVSRLGWCLGVRSQGQGWVLGLGLGPEVRVGLGLRVRGVEI